MTRPRRRAAGQITTHPVELGYRMPAEWETHVATWLAWPHHRTDWPGKAEAVPWVFAEIARQLQPAERVRLLVGSGAERRRARLVLQRAGVDERNIDWLQQRTDRSWTRDYLPMFVTRRAGSRRDAQSARLGAVKWRFNGWARYSDFRQDEAAGTLVAQRYADAWWQPTRRRGARLRRVVLEGGAIDVDGQGTALASELCLLSGPRARNPWLGRAGTEQVLRDYLGIDTVIWLGAGIAGDDTSGHVDDFARFVAPGRVVVGQQCRRRDPDHRPLQRAAAFLSRARDAQGRRLEVVRLPMPEPLYFRGERLPASYLNFYIANRVVLVPSFNDPNDRVAAALLQQLFPTRRVVSIHCADLVVGLGTVHCSTQQEPAVRPGAKSRATARRESAPRSFRRTAA
jgi:agmatine deiminase